MSYEVGSVYRVAFTTRDDTGALVDSTTQTVTVTKPDQTDSTLTVNRDSLGTYHADYTFAGEGHHRFVVVTTGPTSHKTDYANAAIWRSIIGVDEARAYVDIASTEDMTILRQILAGATELAEGIAGACVQRTYTNERITGRQKLALKLPHGPLPSETAVTSITSVYAGGPTWATADLIVYPDSGVVEPINLIPFYWGPWKATYTAGRMVIPERIQLAVKEIVTDLWAMQRTYGATSLEPGPEETARIEGLIAQYVISPHAKAMLELEALPGFGG